MPKLVKIDIIPLDSNVSQFDIIAYTAKGTFSNTTQRDITNEVTWISNNRNVAQSTISYTGMTLNPLFSVYKLMPGAFRVPGSIDSATITAISGKVSSTADMIVGDGKFIHIRQNKHVPATSA